MNRAFLSALALSIGSLLGATAVNDPENLEGWNVLVAQTLEIVRQTAADKREQALLGPDAAFGGAAGGGKSPRRTLIPEPKTVM